MQGSFNSLREAKEAGEDNVFPTHIVDMEHAAIILQHDGGTLDGPEWEHPKGAPEPATTEPRKVKHVPAGPVKPREPDFEWITIERAKQLVDYLIAGEDVGTARGRRMTQQEHTDLVRNGLEISAVNKGHGVTFAIGFNQYKDAPESNSHINRFIAQATALGLYENPYTVYTINYNGRVARLVAAKTKKEAYTKLGVSRHTFNLHAHDTGNEHSIAVAMSAPGTVFEGPITATGKTDWEKVEAANS